MKRKRKGFTLVELLVVIAIIALLMGILMPALAKVRQIAYRMVCGTNVSGIGKAILVYANDNREEYPAAGGPGARWTTNGQLTQFDAPNPADAFNLQVTISSDLYLLVKYAEVPPKQFICKGDIGAMEFKLADFPNIQIPQGQKSADFEDLWDFGDEALGLMPGGRCSYSYQLPHGAGGLAGMQTTPPRSASASSPPETPVIADRNPIFDNRNANTKDKKLAYYDGFDKKGRPATFMKISTAADAEAEYVDQDKTNNSASHQRDGQNVLFNDTHVTFELAPNCGIQKDNIWKPWALGGVYNQEATAQLRQLGPPKFECSTGIYGPCNSEDAWLVNEKQVHD